MEYSSILKGIEEQKKDEQLSIKLFRYTGLIQAIEFFSQKLNMDQIIEAAFDFVNELLTLEKSVVFIAKDNEYVLQKIKGYRAGISTIAMNRNLETLAMFHGTLIHSYDLLEKYFGKEIIDSHNVTTAIPLIMGNALYGFIFVSNKTLGDLGSEDYIISEALMKLFNNALENYKRYEELKRANNELDEKIFNLFAINHSSKALLSELNLNILYEMSVDVFSELTQSSITGFVLYDGRSENYRLKAYKDIYFRGTDIKSTLTINAESPININKVIIDTSVDTDVFYFNSIFAEGITALDELKPKYIVMLLKNKEVLGFVTLGESVTGAPYKNSIFELIESLASSTYIALSNAQLFKEVNDQKKVIQGKLDKLISLNNLMKNINSSDDTDTLIELTLKTLEISFDVQKAMLAVYSKESNTFIIGQTLGIQTEKKEIEVNASWKKVMEGDTIYEASEQGILNYIDKSLLDELGSCPGVLIVPIYIDRVDIEMLGAIIIFKYGGLPVNDDESRLTMETVAGHIAPVLNHLQVKEENAKLFIPNYAELFKRDLINEISEALEFIIDLQVIEVFDKSYSLFMEDRITDRLKDNFSKVYPLSSNKVFILTNEIAADCENKIKDITGLNDLCIRVSTLGKDFNDYQGFLRLYE